ncbi:LPXTG cell wall anchor domain-containing protein [Streptomyces mayteni]
MKLRRALAATAATAVLAPAALLATASAAQATEEEPTPGATQEEVVEETPVPEATETEAPETEAPAEETPDEPGDLEPSTPETEAPETEAPETEAPEEETPGEETPEVPEEPEEPLPGEEECVDWALDAPVATELIGLPSTVVAGEWSEFTYRITNTLDEPVDALHAFVAAEAVDTNASWEDSWFTPELEWSVDGRWVPIEDEFGYFGSTDTLAPGEYAEARMRLRVPASAEGFGWAMTSGVYVDADGVCQDSDWNVYEFDVVAPGSDVEGPDDAEGSEVVGNRPAPQGGLEQIPTNGRLAETGSDSRLPLFALAGATAVALGVGTMVTVRRRQNGAAAA